MGSAIMPVADEAEEQRFKAILDGLKAEFPECAKLALRELKILAGARMRVPEQSRAANGGTVRGWDEAYRVFHTQLQKVIAINKGYKPAEDVERDRIFADYFRAYRCRYPAAMRLDETAVRAFAVCSTTLAIFIGKGLPGHDECYDKALALYERCKAVVESLERRVVPNYQRVNKSFAELYGGTYVRNQNKGQHLCPESCKGGCRECCPTIIGNECPGCLHCNAEYQGIPVNSISREAILSRDLEFARKLINLHAGAQCSCDFNMCVMTRGKYVEYCRARDEGLVVHIVSLSFDVYQTIRNSHPQWLGLPALVKGGRPMTGPMPKFIDLPIDSNFVKQNMEGVRDAQAWMRRQRDEAMRIGTIFHEIHDEIAFTVDYSAVEKKMAQFYEKQLGEPFKPGPDLPKSDIVELDKMLRHANEQSVANAQMLDECRKLNEQNQVAKVVKEPGAIIPCPDCLKTPGKYVGFTVIENCRRCDGSAKIANPDYVPAMLNPCSEVPRTATPARLRGGAKF